MSSVIEIESAIERLPANELEEFASWWRNYFLNKDHQNENIRLSSIEETAGCLRGEEGEAFEKAVAAAGCDVTDTHEW